ncbi:MAG: hypothetical protein SF053_10250 [Bacteroidia bacterium]|nr:hypothetical protein [Bacteroidia bacterium]
MSQTMLIADIRLGFTGTAFTVTVRDARGRVIGFSKRKLFNRQPMQTLYRDQASSALWYTYTAWLQPPYKVMFVLEHPEKGEIGRIAQVKTNAWWNARYDIFGPHERPMGTLREENSWVKVGNSLLGMIPVLKYLTGLMLNPAYRIIRPDGTPIARLTKEASLLGRRFAIIRLTELTSTEAEVLIPGLMLVAQMEAGRG